MRDNYILIPKYFSKLQRIKFNDFINKTMKPVEVSEKGYFVKQII